MGRVISNTYSEHDLYDLYDEMLDECVQDVTIGGLRYSPSQVLKAVDPIAYRCGFLDWLDAAGYQEHPTEDDTYYLEDEMEDEDEDEDETEDEAEARRAMNNEAPYGE